jgi:CspA family cold shock protein
MRGTVKTWNLEKRFGFIKQESGRDVFVHASNIVGGGNLSLGDVVSYEMGVGKSGKSCAVNVCRESRAHEAAEQHFKHDSESRIGWLEKQAMRNF